MTRETRLELRDLLVLVAVVSAGQDRLAKIVSYLASLDPGPCQAQFGRCFTTDFVDTITKGGRQVSGPSEVPFRFMDAVWPNAYSIQGCRLVIDF